MRVRWPCLILFFWAFSTPLLSPHSDHHAQATEEGGSYPSKYSQYNESRNGGDGPLYHDDHHGPKRHSNVGYNNVTCGFRSHFLFPSFGFGLYWLCYLLPSIMRMPRSSERGGFTAIDMQYSTYIKFQDSALKSLTHPTSLRRLSLHLNAL